MPRHVSLMIPGAVAVGAPLEVVAPYDRTPIASVDCADGAAVEQALATADALFRDRDGWLDVPQRLAILARTAVIMTERRDTLALEAAREGGKPLLDSRVEVTIGPYEVYEDSQWGFKAAFETFVTVTDAEQSAQLGIFKDELPWLEAHLPLADEHKNLDRGSESPIRVVDLVYSGGDTRAGIQTIAFNLPNDERVRETKGSKKVLLRNVMDAKFAKILVPIAEVVVAEDQVDHVNARSFFMHTLWHEMSHGLGPGKLVIDGRETEVRLELKDTYSTIEEAKADVMGMWDILKLHAAGREYFPAGITEGQPVTFLAGMFRSVRFGINEAHGRANAIQFNYLLEKGAIAHDAATGKFRVNFERFAPAVELLLNEILVLQAEADYPAAQALIDKYAIMPPVLAAALARLESIPVDIEPVFSHYPEH